MSPYEPPMTSGRSLRNFPSLWRGSRKSNSSTVPICTGRRRSRARRRNAVITGQRADELIAWKSTEGAKNAGVVTFHRLSDQKSRIRLERDYEPEGIIENAGEAIGAVSLRVEGDLERFKE